MGIRERHERERQKVTGAILDAASDLFVSEGFRNVSMRKIAQRIEYSPAAIYSYFASKDDIYYALADVAFGLLNDGIRSALADADDPWQGVRHAVRHYYDFSKSHPQYFELMFVDRSVPRISENWERFAFVGDILTHVTSVMRECIERGHLPRGTDPAAAVHVLWAAIHGAAVIRLCDRLGPGEDPDALFQDVFEAALAGLQAGAPTTFVASDLHQCCADPTPSPESNHAAPLRSKP